MRNRTRPGRVACRLRHDLPYDSRDIEYNDDSIVEMSQTAHDPAARHVTSGDLEPVRGQDLNVSHLVHRQADLLGPMLGQHHRPLGRSRRSGQARCEIDHRHDCAAQVDETANVGGGAGQSRRMANRDDLTHPTDVAAVDGACHREQQQPV